MSKLWILTALSVFTLLGSRAAQGENATDVFARSKAASGGAHWDNLRSLQEDGTLSAGGLSGEFHATQDLLTGRSGKRYKVGPVDGADGYDGHGAWQREPGGEVAAQDAPEAKRRARSQAWLDALGYWYPQRISATYGNVEARDSDGHSYQVVEAKPNGGDPVTLWFATDTGLLARIIQRQGPDTATTALTDYRAVEGVRLPYHTVIDQTDAAGRTDPRRRVEIALDRITPNVAVTDADFAMPAMVATARIDDPSGVTRIPFDLVNNHIYVDGQIDGKPVRFMVDTGGANVLTPAAAQWVGLKSEGKLAAGGVGTERANLSIARAKQVRVGAATLDKPVFYVIDLGDLPKVEGVALDGLVGYEMFRRFGVEIDYAKHQLVLSEPAKFAPPAGATELSFDFDEHMPIVSGTLDGLPVRLTVDTGSRVSLTMNAPFVRTHELVTKYHTAPESVIGWGVGGAARGRPVRFGSLRLGGFDIVGIAGDLFTSDKGGFTNPDQAGNLGGGVLHRFTVAFDYANKKMYLVPNTDFGKADAFDRSGLWLLADGDALKVASVAKDSAAERGGMHENDRIISIAGQAVKERTPAEWRQRLRELPAGTTLEIRFERASKPRSTELVLADRIPPTFMP